MSLPSVFVLNEQILDKEQVHHKKKSVNKGKRVKLLLCSATF